MARSVKLGLSRPRWTLLCLGVLLAANAAAGQPEPAAASVPNDENATEEPFRGITANGQPVYGLFPIETSGVSAAPLSAAAAAFLEALPREQQERAHLPVDDPGWRRWDPHGQDRSGRGIDLGGIGESARQAAQALLEASLSAAGLELASEIMRLGRLPDDGPAAAGGAGYRLAVFGEPSASEPWGWQLEGRDLVINYFVQGDQVVMSPVFLGFPDTDGRAAALREEGAAMLEGLNEAQRQMAALESNDVGIVAGISGDNAVLENVGIPASLMDSGQRARLLALVDQYVGMLRDGHAAVKMAEVEAHLDDTYFTAHGDGPEYYRVFSPVLLIEFERQAVDDEPAHIHTILRTPNGNDYGKALLDQHLAGHSHEAND
jgi:Protein of unknown function (DUF3500)